MWIFFVVYTSKSTSPVTIQDAIAFRTVEANFVNQMVFGIWFEF